MQAALAGWKGMVAAARQVLAAVSMSTRHTACTKATALEMHSICNVEVH
jgi:hypothetical protein